MIAVWCQQGIIEMHFIKSLETPFGENCCQNKYSEYIKELYSKKIVRTFAIQLEQYDELKKNLSLVDPLIQQWDFTDLQCFNSK